MIASVFKFNTFPEKFNILNGQIIAVSEEMGVKLVQAKK